MGAGYPPNQNEEISSKQIGAVSSEHEDKKKTLLIILEGSLNVILDEKEATKEEELSKTLLCVQKSISYEIFYQNQKLAGKILSKQLSSRRNGCNLTKNPYLHSKFLTNEAEEDGVADNPAEEDEVADNSAEENEVYDNPAEEAKGRQN